MIIKRTQQKRFPVFCLICCLTCLFCFIGSISAFAFQTATPSDADKIRITKIQNEDELLALPDFTLPLKSSPSDDDMEPIYLFALKYQTVSATVIENNESRSERFSVCWDFSAIDQTTLGDYAATGRIELPEEIYAFHGSHRRVIRIRSTYGYPKTMNHGNSWKMAFMQGRKCSRSKRIC